MPLRTTVIGAFPKPDYLNIPDWFRNPDDFMSESNRYCDTEGDSERQTLLERALKEVIQEQESLALDVISNGELERVNYVHHFCQQLGGIDCHNLSLTTYRKGCTGLIPTVKNSITFEDRLAHDCVEEWRKAQALTTLPVKMTLPGPKTICDTTKNCYYKSAEEEGLDLVKCINHVVLALCAAGCKYIQIDEPVLVRDPEGALAYGISQLGMCFEGVPSDVTRTVHLCCGYPSYLDQKDYIKADNSIYFKLAPQLDECNIDEVSIEDAHAYNDLTLLKHFKKKTVILGVVAIANSQVETVERITCRVMKALTNIPAERLILAPDCGLGYLPRNILKQKLTNMVTVAKALP